jgi:hypothetical protein
MKVFYQLNLKNGLSNLKRTINFIYLSVKSNSTNQMIGCPILNLIEESEPYSDQITNSDAVLILTSHIILTDTLFAAAAISKTYQMEFGDAKALIVFDREFNQTLSLVQETVKNKL